LESAERDFYPTNLDDTEGAGATFMCFFKQEDIGCGFFCQEEDCLQVRRPVTFMTGLDSGKKREEENRRQRRKLKKKVKKLTKKRKQNT